MAKPLAGGDINEVFLLSSEKERYVLKLNSAKRFPGMFSAEGKGLELLAATKTFRIPKVKKIGEIDDTAYLLMEYILPGPSDQGFWEQFGKNLALLHQNTNEYFGLTHDNYIGSLHQSNQPHQSGIDFFLKERLLPQLEMAQGQGFQFQQWDVAIKNMADAIPDEKASLIHGDLWNGNYFTDHKGHAVLIDPAVCFAHREMDIAMMQLFGGFPNRVFEVYESIFPMLQGWKNRLDIWQLYYLLVHFNLFGSGYYNQVKSIIDRYS